MAKSIKVRAKAKKGVATIKCLISHPMETGLRKDKKSKRKIPAEFIQEITCVHGSTTVLHAQTNSALSKNPYFSFKFDDAKSGDTIKISWVDNKGNSDSTEAKIK